MGIVIPSNGHYPPCRECGEPAEYVCDVCGCNFCCDCAPHRPKDDDAPIDVCEQCIEPHESEAPPC